jgi:hypothetical protein
MRSKMTIEQALASAGPLLAFWDEACLDDEWLGIYRDAGGKPELLAYSTVDGSARAATTADLRRRGVRVGGTAGTSPFFWSDDGSFTVWSLSGRVAQGAPGEITTGGRTVRGADVAQVVSFYDDDDYGHRGVLLELKDGSMVVAVEERDPASRAPGYGMDNLAMEGQWATHLGRALAKWLGASHKNLIPIG